jgi:hypothetical protein
MKFEWPESNQYRRRLRSLRRPTAAREALKAGFALNSSITILRDPILSRRTRPVGLRLKLQNRGLPVSLQSVFESARGRHVPRRYPDRRPSYRQRNFPAEMTFALAMRGGPSTFTLVLSARTVLFGGPPRLRAHAVERNAWTRVTSANYTLPVIARPSGVCTDDMWTPTTLTNAPSARDSHAAVWTGSEMIVWGGSAGPGVNFNSGGRYNPSTDSWTATSTTNAPSPRLSQTAVWAGSEMILWGGTSDSTGGRYCAAAPSPTPTPTPLRPQPRQLLSPQQQQQQRHQQPLQPQRLRLQRARRPRLGLNRRRGRARRRYLDRDGCGSR